MKKLSVEERMLVLEEKYPNSKDVHFYEDKSGTRSRMRVSFICGVCGCECDSLYDNLKKGRACKSCGLVKTTISRRIYTMDYIEKELTKRCFEWLNKDLYTTDDGMIETKCLKCGTISRATHTARISRNRGCSKCMGLKTKEIEEIRSEIDSLGKGRYELISKEYINSKTHIYIKHIDCGHIYKVLIGNFRKGRRCPKCNLSKGEERVEEFLIDKNYKFIREFVFNGLVGDTGFNLRYDFCIPKLRVLIEYDGKLHYIQNAINDLDKRQRYDRMKDDYAKKHNWKLIRIPYWDFDNIEKILEMELTHLIFM